MTPDERLIAYVDGELPDADRAVFEVEMAADAGLAAEVQRHRALAARLAAAYAPILAEPVPLRLTAAARAANDRVARPMGPRQWAAMAACLIVGIAAGRALWPASGPLSMEGGALVARGGLDKALTTQLAAEVGPVKVGLTFRDHAGRYCRTFESPRDSLAGVACRQDGRWIAAATASWRAQAGPDYRTAASGAPPAVLASVDAMIAGETLDATSERAARDKGWTPKATP